jgi:hypothetical protein
MFPGPPSPHARDTAAATPAHRTNTTTDQDEQPRQQPAQPPLKFLASGFNALLSRDGCGPPCGKDRLHRHMAAAGWMPGSGAGWAENEHTMPGRPFGLSRRRGWLLPDAAGLGRAAAHLGNEPRIAYSAWVRVIPPARTACFSANRRLAAVLCSQA